MDIPHHDPNNFLYLGIRGNNKLIMLLSNSNGLDRREVVNGRMVSPNPNSMIYPVSFNYIESKEAAKLGFTLNDHNAVIIDTTTD